ncbi:DUF4189 domain-containing protein [Mycolicibacterium porcinum]|uniref:DUF4189 domain-containing protein n=1 Tax=Mycolicibacterium porcinum TaxID=39693 RepID=UPI0013F4F31D|nr:DUF4189 domain-containing protein [Mycolicibacterium porcinum]
MTGTKVVAGLPIILMAVALPMASTANASPDEHYVALAMSLSTKLGGYGSAGSADRARQIALAECQNAAGAGDCMVVSEIYQGCASYAIQPDGGAWASGKGPDYDHAYWDAVDKLPPADQDPGVYVQCWIP